MSIARRMRRAAMQGKRPEDITIKAGGTRPRPYIRKPGLYSYAAVNPRKQKTWRRTQRIEMTRGMCVLSATLSLSTPRE